MLIQHHTKRPPKSLRIRTILLDYIWDTISLLAIEKMMACY